MKKFTLSAVSLMAISTLAMAGGDVQNVEPAVAPAATVDKNNVYVGLGYSYMNINIEGSQEINAVAYPPLLGETDINGHSFTLLAGYNFHQYLAVEGRYTFSVGDLDIGNEGGDRDLDADLSNLALYLKPMYPVGGVTLYGLLGYGQVILDDGTEYSENGFQWGLGAGYSINDTVGFFVDYTRLYDDQGFDTIWIDQDVVVDSVNVGVTYEF
ncbi:MAG: porin family protein [Sulfurimonas sp.]